MTIKTLAVLPGCSQHEHATWLIGLVGHSRDSDLVEESNWAVTVERFTAIDSEQTNWEIHRFDHFAVGWIEELAYRPDSPVALEAEKIHAHLEDYPVLSEDDLSILEQETIDDNWHDIARELRSKVLPILREWHGWDNSDDDKLDALTDDQWHDAAHDLGEPSDGWISYSSGDVLTIAERLIPVLGFVPLDEMPEDPARG